VGETLGFESIVNAKQLASYAGYDVVLRESGNFKGKTRISKKGNSHIRAALHVGGSSSSAAKVVDFDVYPVVNEQVNDVEFELKKQQKHKALAARDNNLINQLVS